MSRTLIHRVKWLLAALIVISIDLNGAAVGTRSTAVAAASAPQNVSSTADRLASDTIPPATSSHRTLLNQYCVTCHNGRLKTAGLVLDTVDPANVASQAETWEKVVRKLRTGAMPPAGSRRPDKTASDALVSWLEGELDRAAIAHPNPGQPLVHRLNRLEYANSIRDLLALDIDVESLLPPDESGYGFDNIADVLSVTPGLLERYMLAAMKVSRLAVGDPTIRPSVTKFQISPYLVQNERVSDDLPFNSRGGIAVRHNVPLDGEYIIRVRLQKTFAGGVIKGLYTPDQLAVYLDGAPIKLFEIGGECPHANGPGAADPQLCRSYTTGADKGLEVRLPLRAGSRLIGVAFSRRLGIKEGAEPERVPAGGSIASETGDRMGVDYVELEGPVTAANSGDTPSRRRVFVCWPAGAGDDEACARRIVSTLARRAYRRPVTPHDTEVLLRFYREKRKNEGFESGIRFALEGLLASPEFLLRSEEPPKGALPGATYRLSDIELASRLSFFLWSSIPDDQLLDLAEKGRLKDPRVLEAQVRRMLADERSATLVTSFARQWLYLKDLKKLVPDPWAFPDFDDSLREAFLQETELFLKDQLRRDRSVVELLSANYTFVNERLARFYGIPNVYGPRFRRVALPDPARAGLLGHASVLTVTSYSTRTSPVIRGRYILMNLLGSPIPPPPPDVPGFPEIDNSSPTSARARMEQHRRNPACAVCHSRMDPMGFALENFDAIGKWRDNESGIPIDVTGAFPEGGKFSTPTEFREALLNRRDEFVFAVTEKLLTYALGRGVEYYDMPTIRQISRDGASTNHRWSDLILGIAKSPPFQLKVIPDGN